MIEDLILLGIIGLFGGMLVALEGETNPIAKGTLAGIVIFILGIGILICADDTLQAEELSQYSEYCENIGQFEKDIGEGWHCCDKHIEGDKLIYDNCTPVVIENLE